MPAVDEIDRLSSLPLEEFTAARDALVRRLRREGRTEEGADAAKRRKPTLAAWVVNRLARDRPEQVEELLAAANAAKERQPGADARFRAAADALAAGASRVLGDAGRQAREPLLAAVATTLRSAAATQPDELRRGRLTRELQTTGFEAALAGAPACARGTAGSARARRKVDREVQTALAEARRRLAVAREEAKRLAGEAEAAERGARRARADARAAERRVAEAEKRVEAARVRADGLSGRPAPRSAQPDRA